MNAVPLNEITVTFIRYRKPVKLLKQLAALSYDIRETADGIYRISGLAFPCQIIVTREISDRHIILKTMSGEATKEQLQELIRCFDATEDPDDKSNLSAVLYVALEANAGTLKEMKGEKEMSVFWENFMKDEFEKKKTEWKAEGKTEERNMIMKLIQKLMSMGRTADVERISRDPVYCNQIMHEFGMA